MYPRLHIIRSKRFGHRTVMYISVNETCMYVCMHVCMYVCMSISCSGSLIHYRVGRPEGLTTSCIKLLSGEQNPLCMYVCTAPFKKMHSHSWQCVYVKLCMYSVRMDTRQCSGKHVYVHRQSLKSCEALVWRCSSEGLAVAYRQLQRGPERPTYVCTNVCM